jgi:hypothetical protein
VTGKWLKLRMLAKADLVSVPDRHQHVDSRLSGKSLAQTQFSYVPKMIHNFNASFRNAFEEPLGSK